MSLYLSSAAAHGIEVDRSVLQKAGSYVKKSRAVETLDPGSGAGVVLRLRAELLHEKLGRDLDGLGLVKPSGVEGTPRVLISLREKGPGSGTDVGRASDALRRELSVRGYAGIDLSDPLNAKGRQATGSRQEALAAGLASRAEVVVTGEAAAVPVADEALGAQGYQVYRGRLSGEVLLSSGAPVALFDAEATAADATPAGAAAKALESAAEAAGAKLAGDLAARFRRRVEIMVLVKGLSGVEEVSRLLLAVRQVPGVVGAAAGRLAVGETVLRVFVEQLAADELAARLLQHVRGFSLQVSSIEPELKRIELESGGQEL